jgi:Flp pilus assembly protein CpaB
VRNRSNLLVLIGIAFFVVGGIIVYVLTKDDGSSTSSSPGKVTVVVGTQDIPAGATAKDLLANNGLKEQQVPTAQLVPGAVQSLNQLEGATFISGFAKGQQITAAGVQLVNRGYRLPKGYEAVSITVPFTDGDAGYVNVGDQINLYGVLATTPVNGAKLPRAQLLLSNVRVLDVSRAIAANGATGDANGVDRASTDSVTYLLALKTNDVEKVIFSTKFEGIYVSLTDGQSAPAGPTAGVGTDNVLGSAPNANPTAG